MIIQDQTLSDGQIVVKGIQADLSVLDSVIVHHHDNMYSDPRQINRIDWVVRHAMGNIILEVGTATGYVISKINVLDRIGIDNNVARLLLAKIRYPDINFYYANILNMTPFYGQGIDCVIATEILEHLPYDSVRYALYHCLMTAPRVIVTLPHGEHTMENNVEHLWIPTVDLLKQAITGTGLSVNIAIIEQTVDFIFAVLRKN